MGIFFAYRIECDWDVTRICILHATRNAPRKQDRRRVALPYTKKTGQRLNGASPMPTGGRGSCQPGRRIASCSMLAESYRRTPRLTLRGGSI